MNSLVYPVYGGMEDWVYAGGWDPAGVQPMCKGLKQGEKMASTQAAVFLVETSDSKSPSAQELGCEAGVLSNANTAIPVLPILSPGVGAGEGGVRGKHEALCNGHVQRNIRLSLSAIDLVQPYVCLSRLTAQTTTPVSSMGGIQLSWYVGGGHHVDRTWVSLHSSPLQLHRHGGGKSRPRHLKTKLRGAAMLRYYISIWMKAS